MKQEKLNVGSVLRDYGSPNTARKKILVIDDVAFNRLVLAEQLEERYDVIEAGDGLEGLRILKKRFHEISVVILDVQMPNCNGYQFLEQTQGDSYLKAIPIIIASSHVSSTEESRLLELGASDYIEKPAKKNVLLSRVYNLIRLKEILGAIPYLAQDKLTGLLSHQAFLLYLNQILKENPERKYTLIMTDIDRFTFINAIYGAKNADALLRSMAKKLSGYTKNCICGRYSADRFVCLVPSQTVTQPWLEGLMERLKENTTVSNLVIRCGVYGPVDRRLSATGICDRAIFALKSTKNIYDKVIAYYDGPVSQRHLRETGYTLRFQKALRNEEFEVWYQPKYDPYRNAMVGAEALVRWKNPDGSYNMPGEFMSLFETNGMICQLDEYIFRHVCGQQRTWREMGLTLVPISVNLSRNSMHQSDLAERYRAITREYDIEPGLLPIEITESTAIGSTQIKSIAQQLAQAEFPIHMDDFGSENSSLHTLNVLSFQAVKLDKGLIDYIGHEKGELILKCTFDLIRTLGIQIVAEGVETREQLDFLMENGCNQVQGYYFSRVLSREAFEEKLRNDG